VVATATASPHGQLTDRVVAVVEGEPILASDVLVEAALEGLDDGPLPIWTDSFAPPRDRLVQTAALRVFAGSIGLYQPEPEAIQARLLRLKTTLGERWEPFLARFGLDAAALSRRLEARMIAERVLQRNIELEPDDERWVAECREYVRSTVSQLRFRTVDEAP
jgi:hypothetical protein